MMIRDSDGVVLSASDLVNYLGCRHATFLDMRNLGKPPPETAPDPNAELIQKKGFEHEHNCLGKFKAADKQIEIIDPKGTLDQRLSQTRAAMQNGAEVIYQGVLASDGWLGISDFLTRVPGETRFGAYGYEVADAKLSRSARPKYLVQLCVYARLLQQEQGVLPGRVQLLLGDGSEPCFAPTDFLYYSDLAQQRIRSFVATPPAESSPEPCGHCAVCHWHEQCSAEWDAKDHLSLVANITRQQIAKLRAAGIDTLCALAGAPMRVRDMQPETLAKLKQQARLQNLKRKTGQNRCELLAPIPGKGFARLPKPDRGDLFFDMEGDPLIDGGLEYLFGFAFTQNQQQLYRAFWGHSRQEEKRAFEQAVDFITAQLARHPAAHIYHFAAYEEAALKRLSVLHGTREVQIDNLLRAHSLVDLYKVVREGIRVSEPGYSIKNLECFYMPPRDGDIAGGGESIVVYEQWRETQETKLLQDIEDYNRTDCVSTLKLRDWLLTLRPQSTPWFEPERELLGEEKQAERSAAEERLRQTTDALLRDAPEPEREYRELVSQLLEFHRREAKPQYWAMFHRQDLTDEELVEDPESIGCLTRDPKRRPVPDKDSLIHTFRFPAQDYKLREGSTPVIAADFRYAGKIVDIDEDQNRLQLRIGKNQPEFPNRFSLIPGGPLDTRVIRDAIYRYANNVIAGGNRYPAVTGFLKKDFPRIAGVNPGAAVTTGEMTSDTSVAAICGLQDSYLLVQGPPGAGKTWLASHAIVELLKQKRRIGVSSNSHKAINKLLEEVVKLATKQKLSFRGVKKISETDHAFECGFIENVTEPQKASSGPYQLVAGTAWLFARPDMAPLDYLFIDEAGQVSLANVVACGTAARNLVLIGDQMQLAQPTQGVHPGRSGLSALEFALETHATMPPYLGVFLEQTRRMHPDVCRFISDAFYESRLHPAPENRRQTLVLQRNCDAALKPTGLGFVEVRHRDCSQSSELEAERLSAAYDSLLKQRWIDSARKKSGLTRNDILVVSPYNMQVDRLRQMLPDGARIGTVDKFQGQEAAVVLISMATSSHEDLPRNIEFLYSRNRLNVAISRARCLAVIFASPLLPETPCSTIEQMRLVNALCWAYAYAARDPGEVPRG